MAKSNMKSAGIRKHHRRIEHQARVDHRDNRERMFKQKEHVPMIMQIVTLSILANLFGKIRGWGSGFVSRFFTIPSIGLDLTNDTGRNAGAKWLRDIWPALGTMVSTRDGKIIR